MGATSLSHLVVLMVFMGGLALGAVLVGRLVDRGGNGLLYYGWLEVGIGLYAVLFPFLASWATGLFSYLGAYLGPGTTGLLFLKFLIAVLLITAPAVAMGGTLPAVTRYLTASTYGLRRNISLLYGVNSLGAVLGVLLGGFFIAQWFGLSAGMIAAGIFNVSLGLSALGFAWFLRTYPRRKLGLEEESHSPRRLEERLDGVTYLPYASHGAVVAAGLAGFAGMALQVAWIRYFAIVLGATHSAFTIVVAAFIFGIGLGALLVGSRWIGRISLPLVLTVTFLVTVLTLIAGLFFYGRAPFEISRFLAIINGTPYAWPYYMVLKFGICFLLMLLPSVASGMILPLCVRIAGRGGERVGRDVALVYGVNTLGALLGIGITSQLLFRIMTLPQTLQAIMLVYALATIFLALVLREKGHKWILLLAGTLLAAHFLMWQPWSPEQLQVSRIHFERDPSFAYRDFLKENKTYKVVAELQGPDVHVAVMDDYFFREPVRVLVINGKPDASNQPGSSDVVNFVLAAHLPML
ncbi:MAG: hypothetical protein P1P81_11795, partial [Desulfobulbales bacterium]|nr:hypothetical protein [Desulfobulbales bacterium]